MKRLWRVFFIELAVFFGDVVLAFYWSRKSGVLAQGLTGMMIFCVLVSGYYTVLMWKTIWIMRERLKQES